jgi:hypothetical protein
MQWGKLFPKYVNFVIIGKCPSFPVVASY